MSDIEVITIEIEGVTTEIEIASTVIEVSVTQEISIDIYLPGQPYNH